MARSRKSASESAATPSAKAYQAQPGRASRVNEPALSMRRKNFDLDQGRLDQLRTALGAKTEREAIIGAMEIALDVLAFERELTTGAGAMFGTGGFVDVFDKPDALDFGGFAAGARRAGR